MSIVGPDWAKRCTCHLRPWIFTTTLPHGCGVHPDPPPDPAAPIPLPIFLRRTAWDEKPEPTHPAALTRSELRARLERAGHRLIED